MFKKIVPSIIYLLPFPFIVVMMASIQHDIFAGARYESESGVYYMNVHPLFSKLEFIGSIFHMDEFDVLRIFPIVIFGSIIFWIFNVLLKYIEKIYYPVLYIHIKQSIFYYLGLALIAFLIMMDYHGLLLDTAIPIVVVAIVVNVIFVYKESRAIAINNAISSR